MKTTAKTPAPGLNDIEGRRQQAVSVSSRAIRDYLKRDPINRVERALVRRALAWAKVPMFITDRREPRRDDSDLATAGRALRHVQWLITWCREQGFPYAEARPLGQRQLREIFRVAGIRCRWITFKTRLFEVVFPPFLGWYFMYIRRGLPVPVRRCAMRHGLAHVLDGHLLRKGRKQTTRGQYHLGYEERVADLFALADLIPDQAIARQAASRRLAWLRRRVSRLFPAKMPRARLYDRAVLRLALFNSTTCSVRQAAA